MKIRKNDTVIILQGKDRGKKGKVLQLLPTEKKIVVENLNVLIRHLRPRRMREKGQKIHFNAPLDSSNVALICPKCSRQTRIGHKILENKKKVRLCRKCREIID